MGTVYKKSNEALSMEPVLRVVIRTMLPMCGTHGQPPTPRGSLGVGAPAAIPPERVSSMAARPPLPRTWAGFSSRPGALGTRGKGRLARA
eukprot:3155683-Pyramimonas_sp.AAC.1